MEFLKLTFLADCTLWWRFDIGKDCPQSAHENNYRQDIAMSTVE